MFLPMQLHWGRFSDCVDAVSVREVINGSTDQIPRPLKLSIL